MTTEPTGGPAFPTSDVGWGPTKGMTLRDYFVGQALAGMIQNPIAADAGKDLVAEQAYLYADVMLEERDK